MTGRVLALLALALLALAPLALVASGCGEAPEGEGSAVDSSFVEVLADLHLADARAALDTTAADRRAFADSLRRAVLADHSLDSADLRARLDALAADPEQVRATYDALDTRLSLERQGISR